MIKNQYCLLSSRARLFLIEWWLAVQDPTQSFKGFLTRPRWMISVLQVEFNVPLCERDSILLARWVFGPFGETQMYKNSVSILRSPCDDLPPFTARANQKQLNINLWFSSRMEQDQPPPEISTTPPANPVPLSPRKLPKILERKSLSASSADVAAVKVIFYAIS